MMKYCKKLSRYIALSCALMLFFMQVYPSYTVMAKMADETGVLDDTLVYADHYDILIQSTDDFIAFSQNCALDTWSQGKVVKLDADIDLSGVDFMPIPTFGGTFEGNEHIISGLNLEGGASYQGLFRCLQESAIVREIHVKGMVKASGVEEYTGGIVGINEGKLLDCSFQGEVFGKSQTGGIVGINKENGSVIRCVAKGSVVGEKGTGGIAGENNGTIKNCTNYSDINTVHEEKEQSMEDGFSFETFSTDTFSPQQGELMDTTTDTGGIAGYSDGTLDGCCNEGAVGYPHVGYNVGGIVGRNSGHLEDCSNMGYVQGRKDVGGISGQMVPDVRLIFGPNSIDELKDELDRLGDMLDSTLDNMDGNTDTVSERLRILSDYTKLASDDAGDMMDYMGDWADDSLDTVNEAMDTVSDTLDRMESIVSHGKGILDTMADGIDDLERSLKKFANGMGLVEDGMKELEDGIGLLRKSFRQMQGSFQEIQKALEKLSAALPELDEATLNQIQTSFAKLSAALEQFDKAIQMIMDAFQKADGNTPPSQTESTTYIGGSTENYINNAIFVHRIEPVSLNNKDKESGEIRKAESKELEIEEPEEPEKEGTESGKSEENISIETQQGESKEAENEKTKSNDAEGSESEVTESGRTESSGTEETNSSEIESSEIEETNSSEIESSEIEETNSSEIESSEIEETNSSEIESSEIEETNSSEIESSEIEETNSSEIESSEIEETNSSEIESSEIEETNSSEIESSEIEETNSSEIESSEIEETNSSEIESSEIEETNSSEIESSQVEETNSSETENGTGTSQGGIDLSKLQQIMQALKMFSESLKNASDAAKDLGQIFGKFAMSTDWKQIKESLDSITSAINKFSKTWNGMDKAMSEIEKSFRSFSGMGGKMEEGMESMADAMKVFKKGFRDMDDVMDEMHDLLQDLSNREKIQFKKLGDDFKNTEENLHSTMNSIGDQMNLLQDEMENSGDTLSTDVRAMTDQFQVISDLLMDSLNDVQDKEKDELWDDVSEQTIDSTIFGKAKGCVNKGTVEGDLCVGGIAGAMAIERDFDPEDDISEVGEKSLDFRYETRAILQNCVNNGRIVSKKDAVGGVVGRMNLGYILNCENYGFIESTDGDYIGGIAGYSNSTIRGCWSKCTLTGGSYIGGIAGYGYVITQCVSLMAVEETEGYAGAVAGDWDREDGDLVSNRFVEGPLAGVDGISYSGKAEPVVYANLVQEQNVPAPFYSFAVICMADERIVDETVFAYGEKLVPEKFPVIPEKDGYFGIWQDVGEDFITIDHLLEAVYLPYINTLESETMRDQTHAVFLMEGRFDNRAVLKVKNVHQNELSEQWSVSLTGTDDGKEHIVRFAPPADWKETCLYLCKGDERQLIEADINGSYLVFTVYDFDFTLEVVKSEQESDSSWKVFLIVAGIVIIMSVIIYLKRKQNVSQSDSEHEQDEEDVKGDGSILRRLMRKK